jgi:C4-dicarboxylate transporter
MLDTSVLLVFAVILIPLLVFLFLTFYLVKHRSPDKKLSESIEEEKGTKVSKSDIFYAFLPLLTVISVMFLVIVSTYEYPDAAILPVVVLLPCFFASIIFAFIRLIIILERK